MKLDLFLIKILFNDEFIYFNQNFNLFEIKQQN